MNAIKLLKADHQAVEALFKSAESTQSNPEKKKIFAEIRAALEAHAYIEETIFYPTLLSEGDKKLVEITSEAIKEHVQAKSFLGELAVTDNTRFKALLTKLIEDVRHHVVEEETIMFPMVQSQFDENALEIVGSQMESENERFGLSTESAYN
jgi:iron-sulfur cluster repair protein YtfE (RIC family)